MAHLVAAGEPGGAPVRDGVDEAVAAGGEPGVEPGQAEQGRSVLQGGGERVGLHLGSEVGEGRYQVRGGGTYAVAGTGVLVGHQWPSGLSRGARERVTADNRPSAGLDTGTQPEIGEQASPGPPVSGAG
ncbi:hypothetical protein [Streptomyces sp. NRRL F-5527]|uniref:hypothetical protein n=1 Tax=Streptomyces sp. NRRL F-5527 TaxID=1463862 RepID=UPI00131D8673|nr:hypothetical protein [Streptomyces sp. NRRL F-5527]